MSDPSEFSSSGITATMTAIGSVTLLKSIYRTAIEYAANGAAALTKKVIKALSSSAAGISSLTAHLQHSLLHQCK